MALLLFAKRSTLLQQGQASSQGLCRIHWCLFEPRYEVSLLVYMLVTRIEHFELSEAHMERRTQEGAVRLSDNDDVDTSTQSRL